MSGEIGDARKRLTPTVEPAADLRRKYHVSVLLNDPPHAYATNPRLDVIAVTTEEVYDLVARRYPSGVVMGIWDKGPVTR